MEEVFDKNSILDSHPHYVFVQKDKHGFAIFSKFRIPFDKTKHAIINNLKNDIIQSIKLLDSDNKTILLARYGTTRKQGFYDIENILFYNLKIKNQYFFEQTIVSEFPKYQYFCPKRIQVILMK